MDPAHEGGRLDARQLDRPVGWPSGRAKLGSQGAVEDHRPRLEAGKERREPHQSARRPVTATGSPPL